MSQRNENSKHNLDPHIVSLNESPSKPQPKKLLQQSASKIKPANRLLTVREAGSPDGGASAPTGLAQGGRIRHHPWIQ